MKVDRRRTSTPAVNLSSMGDIAFLLIIFFVLTTNFLKEAKAEYELSTAAEIQQLKESSVSVVVDEDGVVWCQGHVIDAQGLEGAVSSYLETAPDKTVMVKIDKNLTKEQYGEVILALSRAQAEIALVGEKE
ncbi:MAG: ExbD/TolR family protein [Planctomycetota bacterium]|jgi:biopolymer transport protein ExbD